MRQNCFIVHPFRHQLASNSLTSQTREGGEGEGGKRGRGRYPQTPFSLAGCATELAPGLAELNQTSRESLRHPLIRAFTRETAVVPLSERIVLDPEVLAGKPVIRGTRLAVEFILELLASGQSESELLTNYPRLAREDILACLAYANYLAHEYKAYPISAHPLPG